MRWLAVQILGMAVATIGVLTLVGHVVGVRALVAWFGDSIGMAVSTAVSLVAIGLALVLAGWKKGE